MAKKSSIQRNNKRKRMNAALKKKRAALKAEIYNKNIDIEDRFALVVKLSELPRNSSRTRIRNRCELTGRPRGYYRKFKLSRIKLREFASAGLVAGVVKSSW